MVERNKSQISLLTYKLQIQPMSVLISWVLISHLQLLWAWFYLKRNFLRILCCLLLVDTLKFARLLEFCRQTGFCDFVKVVILNTQLKALKCARVYQNKNSFFNSKFFQSKWWGEAEKCTFSILSLKYQNFPFFNFIKPEVHAQYGVLGVLFSCKHHFLNTQKFFLSLEFYYSLCCNIFVLWSNNRKYIIEKN